MATKSRPVGDQNIQVVEPVSYDASGNPVTDSSGAPAVNTTSSPTTLVKYSDATYEYYAEAAVGTARSTAAWRVFRKTIATGDIVYAGTGAAEHAATDLATVGALIYTLGA